MHSSKVFIIICAFLVSGILVSCGSSGDATQKQDQKTPAEQAPGVSVKADSLGTNNPGTPKAGYDPNAVVPGKQNTSPAGKFSVQVGAYSMADNAQKIAAIARERFNKNVYTVLDPAKNLYKVMVGDFSIKDEARTFRDEMAKQFPVDYKDAWVAENLQ